MIGIINSYTCVENVTCSGKLNDSKSSILTEKLHENTSLTITPI